jgi:prephenate dehydrogenase
LKISIIGLGLIGGSLAKALKGFGSEICGCDIDKDVLRSALESKAIDRAEKKPRDAVSGADLIIFASSPETVIRNMSECLREGTGAHNDGPVVTEICGVKKEIIEFVEKNLPDINYAGLHPMAGKEVGGFINSDAELFKDAGFIIIPSKNSNAKTLRLLTELSLYVGAGRIVTNDPETHDKVIAYTSDLPHIVATAMCRDFPPEITMAHTAGAFRGTTRVAKIDAALWRELLLRNAQNIIPFLETYINNLSKVNDALKNQDGEFIYEFLKSSSENKVKILES